MIFIYLPNTTRLLSITCRAVYSEADLYLLDGPLSAVDPEIEHHLFEECISDLLESSAVVLVTHQLAIAQLSDNVMVMKGVSATYYRYTLSTCVRNSCSLTHPTHNGSTFVPIVRKMVLFCRTSHPLKSPCCDLVHYPY